MIDMAKIIPNMDADTTSDGCHLLGLLIAIGLGINLLFFHTDPSVAAIGLVGLLFAGGIVNSKVNGTAGQ